MVKPHGFVLDFIGIFEKLEKALSFDSDEINAIVKDLALLKTLFKNKMEGKVHKYLKLITQNFNDKDVDNLIEHFRDKDRRKDFFKEYKECEMLYEIISPDAFLRPYIDSYTSFAAMYHVVRKAYTKKVYVDKEFMRKTGDLVKEKVEAYGLQPVNEVIEIDEKTIEIIKNKGGGDNTKIINLIKSIEKYADEQSDDPFLIAMAERAKIIQESYEDRQTATNQALEELLNEIRKNEERKKEQEKLKLDSLTYFLHKELETAGIEDSIEAGADIKNILEEFSDWHSSEKSMREARKKVTIRIFRSLDDLEKVASLVDDIFSILVKSRDSR